MLQLEYVRAITNGAKISVSQQILIHDEADGFNPTGATNCHQLHEAIAASAFHKAAQSRHAPQRYRGDPKVFGLPFPT
jgi:hypothetical protein